ncbi:MAG TPA: VOC family protein, partial [Jiangellales bacterium]|nr:VOC family protein [Jiangellales bacterium]
CWPEGGGVMLGSVREGGVLDGLPPGTGSVYVVVTDPDELFARATAAGATVVRALRDEDYGSRDFVVRDPEGVFWCFGTYAGE